MIEAQPDYAVHEEGGYPTPFTQEDADAIDAAIQPLMVEEARLRKMAGWFHPPTEKLAEADAVWKIVTTLQAVIAKIEARI